jgi:hypothetical protein
MDELENIRDVDLGPDKLYFIVPLSLTPSNLSSVTAIKADDTHAEIEIYMPFWLLVINSASDPMNRFNSLPLALHCPPY